MKRATITEAKNQLSALIDQVRAGQTVLILDRGIPVARLEPVTGRPDPEGRLERLERAGIIRRAKRPLSPEDLSSPPPRPLKKASALEALLEERRSGR